MEIEAIDVRAEDTKEKAAEWLGKKLAEGFTDSKIYKTKRYYFSSGTKSITDVDIQNEYVCISIKK